MNLNLMVNVAEFRADDEQIVESQVVDVTAYDDGTVEFGVNLSGKNRRVYVRFALSDATRIALTTDNREEAP